MKKLCLALILALPFYSAAQTINPNQIKGIGVYASGYTTLAAIETACGVNPCQVIVATPQTFTLAANHTIPSTIALYVQKGGSWTLNGAFTLTVGSGSVEGPESGQIFAGSASVNGLTIARPEWFGSNVITTAVVNSLRPGGTVIFNNDAYTTPFVASATAPNCMPVNNINFIGASAPQTLSDWTGLTGGTIIKGGMDFCGDNVYVKHMGFDVGSAWVAAGHPASDALVFEGKAVGNPADPLVKNPHIEDVVAITNGVGNVFHAVRAEHTIGASILNVKAAMAFHCFAFKSINSTLEGLDAHGCGGDGLILKGDNYTSASNLTASKIYVESINPGDTGAGIQLQAGETGTLGQVHVSNFTVNGAVWGLRIIQSSTGGGGTAVSNSSISDGLILTKDVLQPPIGFIVDDGGTGGGKTVANISVSNINFVNGITGAVPVRFLIPFNSGVLSNWLTVNSTTSNLFGNFSINGWMDAGAATTNPTFSATGVGTVVQATGVTSQRGNLASVSTSPANISVSPNPFLLSAGRDGGSDTVLVNGVIRPPVGGSPITIRSAAPASPALVVQNSTGTANRFLLNDDGSALFGGLIQPLTPGGTVTVRGDAASTINFAVQNSGGTNTMLVQGDTTTLLGSNIVPAATTQNPTGTCTLAGFIPMRLTNVTTVNIAVCQ